MTETEYAVRLGNGEVMPRPSLALARSSVVGITARGGTAVLLRRTVVRSDWAEMDETLSKEAWHRTFPAIYPWHADGAACYRQGCAVLHEPKDSP